jgi:hypothetical protein
MTYRVSYEVGLATRQGREEAKRTEYFCTEFEALRRARELFEGGDHHGIAVCGGDGRVLGGIRLQLKLGMQFID